MPSLSWFATNAARDGRLVYYMDQSSTAPLDQPGPWGDIDEGYCASLAVRWIGLAYRGRDFPAEPGYNFDGVSLRWFKGTDYQATIYQNRLNDFFKATNPDRRTRVQYALGLGQTMLGSDLVETSTSPVTASRLLRIVRQSYGCYYVSLGGPDWGHAIALRHARPPNGKGSGVLHIFDANSGHFAYQMPSAGWDIILDHFLDFGEYNKDSTGYCVARATPPVC